MREKVTQVVLAAWGDASACRAAGARCASEAWLRPDAEALETTPIPPNGDDLPF